MFGLNSDACVVFQLLAHSIYLVIHLPIFMGLNSSMEYVPVTCHGVQKFRDLRLWKETVVFMCKWMVLTSWQFKYVTDPQSEPLPAVKSHCKTESATGAGLSGLWGSCWLKLCILDPNNWETSCWWWSESESLQITCPCTGEIVSTWH